MFRSVVLIAAIFGPPVDGFVSLRPSPSSNEAAVVRHAKKVKKKPSKTTSTASGGFGAPLKKSQKLNDLANDDYAIFPALEPQVQDTLVPVTNGQEPGLDEVYQRLAQIYGFPNFNHDPVATTQQKTEAQPISFQDLISSSTAESAGLPTSSNSNNQQASPIEQLPAFDESKLHVLHVDPLVLQIDDFFNDEECDQCIRRTQDDSTYETGSLTVGKDAVSKAQRTSTTWFHHFKDVPHLMAKASRLLGLDDIDQWEEPQTVRYRRNEKFTWHLDALGPTQANDETGGQRTVTLLVYHTDLEEEEGGATVFRDLGPTPGEPLRVRPKKGSALLFFPSAGGIPGTPLDIRTLHCGEAVSGTSAHDKWISQLWLRTKRNTYTPTAPPGNEHAAASGAIADFCASVSTAD